MARIQLYSVVLLLLAQTVLSQIDFTGDAYNDFVPVGGERNRTKNITPNNNAVGVSAWMAARGRTTGWDLKSTNVQYDYRMDTLFVGLDCWMICGDADGDGNPGYSADGGADVSATEPNPECLDYEQQIETESIAMTLWTTTPESYTGAIKDASGKATFNQYFPDIVIGDTFLNGLSTFGAYTFTAPRENCEGLTEEDCNGVLLAICGVPGDYFGLDYHEISTAEGSEIRGVDKVQLFAIPNATFPDIEFKMPNFSHYGGFNFTPGIDSVRFAYSVYAGSTRDCCGEEIQYPLINEFGCLNSDACGECGGDNSTCLDCMGIANGGHVYDYCGVCGGHNETCMDCAYVANGPNRYDACGVCNGNNRTCWDCAHVPNGPKRYDACGVCDGNNQTCWDCAHKPNGPARYDACGVCAGNNRTCWDCAHIPNGPNRYDACGVCNGDNTTCWDCAHTPNGRKRYDACGVCDGNNRTCWDCKRIPNGPNRYDACGVCAGNNRTCWDCAHIPNGPARYDGCGVCGGHNDTCGDCFGMPNGKAVYDICGVCGGHNDTCGDCRGVPNGGWEYDLCGVCGGDNQECDCFFKDTLTFHADDTYVQLAHRERNHGLEDILEVKWNRSRTLVQFNEVKNSILQVHKFLSPNQTTEILSAKLYFNIAKVGSGWEDPDIALHKIGPFVEKEANWDCSAIDTDGCCKQWRMIGLPPQVEASYQTEPSGVAQIDPLVKFGKLEFDLLDEVYDLVHNETLCGQEHLSYILKKVCEHGPGAIWFWSCESAKNQCPRLVVEVRTRCPVRPRAPEPVNPCADENEAEHEEHK